MRVESLTTNPCSFELAIVYYVGQSTEANDIESGLHLLMNMDCYEGKELYRPNVAVKKMRIKYSAEIVACLFLADIFLREHLLKEVAKFKAQKEKASKKTKKDKEANKDEETTPNSQLVVTPEYLDLPAIATRKTPEKRAWRIKIVFSRKKMKTTSP